MAPIRRAKSYFTYLLALFISGFFSLFGKVGPSWAEEAKTDHSAQVFEQLFRVAQADTTLSNKGTLKSPASLQSQRLQMPADRLQMPADRLQMPADRLQMPVDRLQMPALPEATSKEIDAIIAERVTAITNKNPQELTTEDMALLRATQNAALLEQIVDRLNAIEGKK